MIPNITKWLQRELCSGYSNSKGYIPHYNPGKQNRPKCNKGDTVCITYRLDGRKMEECAGELGNIAHHKRGLTSWRGGRGRSGLVSLETWHVTNEDSLAGGEEEGGVGW